MIRARRAGGMDLTSQRASELANQRFASHFLQSAADAGPSGMAMIQWWTHSGGEVGPDCISDHDGYRRRQGAHGPDLCRYP